MGHEDLDQKFNDYWKTWNLTPTEKTLVFEAMRFTPGSADYYLNAKHGRKFTDPISEFAQYVTTNYSDYMAGFIRRSRSWAEPFSHQVLCARIAPSSHP